MVMEKHSILHLPLLLTVQVGFCYIDVIIDFPSEAFWKQFEILLLNAGDVCQGDTVLFTQKVHEKYLSLPFLSCSRIFTLWL